MIAVSPHLAVPPDPLLTGQVFALPGGIRAVAISYDGQPVAVLPAAVGEFSIRGFLVGRTATPDVAVRVDEYDTVTFVPAGAPPGAARDACTRTHGWRSP
jgi:hypothetical protein